MWMETLSDMMRSCSLLLGLQAVLEMVQLLLCGVLAVQFRTGVEQGRTGWLTLGAVVIPFLEALLCRAVLLLGSWPGEEGVPIPEALCAFLFLGASFLICVVCLAMATILVFLKVAGRRSEKWEGEKS